jgi:TP901 family phage tail tape measure protein
MATQTAELIVRLIDAVSGPAAKVRNALNGISGQLGRVNAGISDRLARNDQMMQNAGAQLGASAAGLAGALGALAAPASVARDFETLLIDIGQKADLAGPALSELGRRIRTLAPQVNRSGMEVAQAMDFLLGVGLDPGRAEAILPAIGRTATAYRAAVEDISKAAFAGLDNLRVPTADLGRMLDGMAQAGKEGAFELRDMARYLPTIAAAAQRYGMVGVEASNDIAAALQVVRRGTGDASTAATNLRNILNKVLSPETLSNFTKAGVDLRAEYNAARAAAEAAGQPFSAIEFIVRRTRDALGGDLSRMGELFADQDVVGGLTPLIQQFDEYIRIRRRAGEVSGVVDADFAGRIASAQSAQDRFTASMQELGIALGNSILPAMIHYADIIGRYATQLAGLIDAHPKLAAALLGLAVALPALRLAFWGIGLAVMILRGALLQVANIAVLLGRGLLIALANPVVLAILLGIAAAIGFISANWEGLGAAADGFGSGFMKEIEPLLPVFNDLMGYLKPITDGLSSLLGWMRLDIDVSSWRAFGETLGTIAGQTVVGGVRLLAGAIERIVTVGRGLKQVFDEVVEAVPRILDSIRSMAQQAGLALGQAAASFAEKGAAMIQSLWDGMVSKFSAMLEWVRSIPSRILSAIGSIDLSSVIRMPSFGSVGRRASGGHAEGLTIVGERGPELVNLPRGSYVNEAARTRGMLGGGCGSNISFSPTINVTSNGSSADPRDIARQIADELGQLLAKARREALFDT